MTTTDRDKFLTEAMGECCVHEWYKPKGYISGHFCKKCNTYWPVKPESQSGIVNFSTWESFGKLWKWAKNKEWFCLMMAHNGCGPHDIVNPDRFAAAVYEYLKEK